jgi:hypothetical protein
MNEKLPEGIVTFAESWAQMNKERLLDIELSKRKKPKDGAYLYATNLKDTYCSLLFWSFMVKGEWSRDTLPTGTFLDVVTQAEKLAKFYQVESTLFGYLLGRRDVGGNGYPTLTSILDHIGAFRVMVLPDKFVFSYLHDYQSDELRLEREKMGVEVATAINLERTIEDNHFPVGVLTSWKLNRDGEMLVSYREDMQDKMGKGTKLKGNPVSDFEYAKNFFFKG